MTFQPIVPLSGFAGWSYLSNSVDTQIERMGQSSFLKADFDYFRENIGSVTSASELVSDFRLRRVALGAFGLSDDIANKAFIERVLSDGTSDQDALSNRLADKRYHTFSEAFGFGSVLPPKTQLPGFADQILAKFQRQEFERTVGEQDENMRLALTVDRELPDLASRGYTDTTGWLSILGNPPLRQVFEVAFGLPDAIGTLDLDQQIREFKAGAERVLDNSDFSVFEDRAAVDDLIRTFTLKAQLEAGISASTPGVAALTLLQSITGQ